MGFKMCSSHGFHMLSYVCDDVVSLTTYVIVPRHFGLVRKAATFE